MNRLKSSRKSNRLALGAGLLLSVFGRKPRSHSADELYKKDFRPNTQKMGLCFTERLRKVWRPKWLRLK
jgi:hypothetical protein